MDINTEGWSLSDWKQYALELRDAHQSALDGWGITVAELEAHSKLVGDLRKSNELLRNHVELLQSAMTLISIEGPVKRGKGRPRKHGDVNLAAWYDRECLPKFRAHNHGATAGMQKVLTWHFQQVFRERGWNPLKVNHKDYQAKLKTMVNIISDQRHPGRSAKTS